MNDEVKISIIIASFNTKDILKDCLMSIDKAEIGCKYEIIVVDNNSIDGSAGMIKKLFPAVAVIENNRNNLYAKANNQGATIAKGKYLLLLNSDTLIEKGNIEKLVLFLDRSPTKVACVGPLVLNHDRTLQSWGFALPSIVERFSMVFHLNRLMPKPVARLLLPSGIPGLYEKNHRVGWVSGCCMLIRSDVYKALGGLNEDLEFYGEEPEFGTRLQKNGYKTFVVNDASIIHLGGKSSSVEGYAYFLKDEAGNIKRYIALQKHTVGIKKSIIMSRIVILSAMIKFLILKRKRAYFRNAIQHEKKVICYMKKEL